MDVLTEALSSMRTGRPSSVRTEGRAPWGLRLPPIAGSGFHVVLQGTCWLVPLAGTPCAPAPIALGPGDVVFLRAGHGHVLTDQPGSPVVDMTGDAVPPDSPIGSVTLGGDGALTRLLCGAYHLDQNRPHPLLSHLPALVHLPASRGRHPELAAAVQLLGSELENPRTGSAGIVPSLIDALLLYILRAWLDEQDASTGSGWAAALRDPAIAAALTAIHADPAAPWTVAGLAARVGLSRAGFARRFAALIGEPPLAYLTRWRMTTAARLLREGDTPLSTVATRTGYGSEYALGKAFKREYGLAPGSYRRQVRAA
ncbi:cupin domain-containing protein [Kitasatospora sp. NPDC058965]|uniref:AraC family transcriptional regulator n=1 Tax=Kitasatospora sp. NPDC058965 TaxID=3346682 RepID=UPI0036908BC3